MNSSVAGASFLSRKLSSPVHHLKIFLADHPALYLVLLSMLALTGYAYLLFFPALTVLSVYQLALQAGEFSNLAKLPIAAAWFTCLVAGSLVTYRMIKIRISQPHGISLNAEKAPELFKLIEDIKQTHGKVRFDRILLNEENKLEVIKVPVFGLPVVHQNILVIGLPVLINLTSNQFRSAMIRKLSQYSRFRMSVTHWLAWLGKNWQQYNEAYAKQKKFGHLPLRLFFRVYSPLYQKASVMAARLDELNVDSRLLSDINDEDLLDMIQGEFVSRFFLENAYWPRVRRFVRKSPSSTVLPHQKMAELLNRGLPQKDAMQLLADALNQADSIDSPLPSLKTRMQNIGHQRIKVPYQSNNNAAQHYLGSSYLAYVRVIDISWLSSTLNDWKKQDKDLRQDYSELKSLRAKANSSRLSYREMLVFSRLSKKLYGKNASIALKNILLKRVPEAA